MPLACQLPGSLNTLLFEQDLPLITLPKKMTGVCHNCSFGLIGFPKGLNHSTSVERWVEASTGRTISN